MKLEFWWTVEKKIEMLFVHASLPYSKTWLKLLTLANLVVIIVKLCKMGAGKVAQSLIVLSSLAEEMGFTSNAHVGWLMVSCIFSSRTDILFWRLWYLHSYTHTHRKKQTTHNFKNLYQCVK